MLKKQFIMPMLLLSLPLAKTVLAEEPMQTLSYQFYGQLNLGLLSADNEDGKSTWKLENLSSRLGIKGEQALEHGLTLIFQYETGINPTEKSTPIFTQRNSFIGLKNHQYGQLIYGVHDTPFKTAHQKVDLFDSTSFDITSLLAGEVRHEQSVQYRTPQYMGFSAAFGWMPAEETERDDGFSTAIHYERQSAAFSIAMDKKVMGDSGVIVSKTAPLDNYRATVGVKLGESIALSGLAQLSKGVDADQSEEKSWLASAKWQLDRTALKAQVGQSLAVKNETGASSNRELSQAIVGADYSLANNILVYVYSGFERTTNEAKKHSTTNRTGLGLRFKF